MQKLTVLFYLRVLAILFIVSADIHRVSICTGLRTCKQKIGYIAYTYRNTLALSNSKYLTNNQGGESRPVLN